MDSGDDKALLEGLRSGRSDAFQQAIEQYSASMLATARSIAGSANAEDIVQDAWLTVFQRVDTFEQRASFRTWLQRIVANRAISHLRSHSREVSQAAIEDNSSSSAWFDAAGSWIQPPTRWHVDSPDALLEADELQNCLEKHLQQLPENQRRVLVLRDIQQMALDDICNELTLSASNARVLLHRGRTRLMNMVNHFKDTGSC
jgi:RNA polymerase sigma-70 factor (ECF subfamily)